MSLFRAPGHLLRLLRVSATLSRSGALREIVERSGLAGWRAHVIRAACFVIRPFGVRVDQDGPPIPAALTALGPAEVKLGQTLATRPDVVGARLAGELRRLQDRQPPFEDAEARRTIEQEFDAPVEALFTEFGPPLAAASIAQVHRARTAEGADVAVKILRPGIEAAFFRDIDAFRFMAGVVEAVAPSSRRLKPVAVYEHFAETTRIELDLQYEAAAASEFRENTLNDPGFHVPEVDWRRSSRRVLTTEWVDGIAISDRAAVMAQGIDPARLAKTIIQSFLRQALRDGFFHADMHQGNLRVDAAGRIVALDFGIMGRLDPLTRRHYAEILLAFLDRDYARAAMVHREAGYLDKDQPIDAFAQALRSVGEPIFGLGARNISMARLLGRLFTVTEQFGMETQTQLILLQKTMVMVEGVARDLDADFNMWQAAKPVVQEWMLENLGPKSLMRDMREGVRVLTRIGPRFPELAERLVTMAEADDAPPPSNGPWASMGPLLASGLIGGAFGGFLVVLLG